MRRDIGNMRHRLTIKSIGRTADDYGGTARSDSSGSTVWASVEPASPREVAAYSQLQQRLTHVIKMRHRTDVAQGQTLVDESNTEYYVLGVVNPDTRKRFIEVHCRVGGPL